jgi:hypothetical protein
MSLFYQYNEDYDRSWVYVRPEIVPGSVIHVPGDYRARIRGSERIHVGFSLHKR